jgi:hypothetical protein
VEYSPKQKSEKDSNNKSGDQDRHIFPISYERYKIKDEKKRSKNETKRSNDQ